MRRGCKKKHPVLWESIKIMKMIGGYKKDTFQQYFDGETFYHNPHISWQDIYERWRKVRKMIFKVNGYKSKQKCHKEYPIDGRVFSIKNRQHLHHMMHYFSDRFSNSRALCFDYALKKVRARDEGQDDQDPST